MIEQLDQAIDFYAQLADYDRSDLADTVTYVQDRAAQLPKLHSDVWELFAAVKGAKDTLADGVDPHTDDHRHSPGWLTVLL